MQKKVVFSLIGLIWGIFSSKAVFSEEFYIHAVRPGETIWDICLRLTDKKDCWMELGPFNGVSKPKKLPPSRYLNIPVAWLKTQPLSVEATVVKGEVFFSPNARTAPLPLPEKTLLAVNSIIYTETGEVRLTFGDGSTLLLEPNSKISLDRISTSNNKTIVDTQLRLYNGQVNTYVPPGKKTRFKVDTPSAVATVRGTEFRINVESASGTEKSGLRGEVVRGVVDFSANKVIEPVKAGFGILAEEGKPLSKPIKLLEAPNFVGLEKTEFLPLDLQWNTLPNAKKYHLQIFKANNKERVVNQWLDRNDQKITDLKEDCYEARISASDEQALEGAYDLKNFCISPVYLTQPDLDDQHFHKGFWKKSPLLLWNQQEKAASYIIEGSKDANFNELSFSQNVSDTQYTLPDQVANYGVYLRVKARDAHGNESQYSKTAHWKSPKYGKFFTVLSSVAILIMVL